MTYAINKRGRQTLCMLVIAISLTVALATVVEARQPRRAVSDHIRADVTALGDDATAGRLPGTPGFDRAARHVAGRFRVMGLHPAARDGSYFQVVPLARSELVGRPTIEIGGRRLESGGDVAIAASFAPVTSVAGEAVFVGYGIDAPEVGMDDYAGLDLHGKVAVFLNGFPPSLPGEVGAHLANRKGLMAKRRGAVATVELETLASARRRPWSLIRDTVAQPVLTWIGDDGAPWTGDGERWATARLEGAAAASLFAGASRPLASVLAEADAAKATPRGFPLAVRVTIDRPSKVTRFESSNVVAMLPGSDPSKRRQAVVVTAHLDHLGRDPARQGDQIFNGVIDNAFGVAEILDVARRVADARSTGRPVLFAAVTAEEGGMIGSQYLVRHLPLPKGVKAVANVNIDGPILTYPFTDIVALGAEHSNLGDVAEVVAARMGLQISPDQAPEQGYFVRSDNYRFVQDGIPALALEPGWANGGKAAAMAYARRYHQPSDDLSQTFDWTAAARFAELNAAIVEDIANAPQAPRWRPGSYFRK